jgi:gas vesicle protein
METADGITVTGHAHRADRLLIRPASGRQADTGLSARTHHWKDTAKAKAGHSRIESRTKSTDANLTNAPDGTLNTLTVHE